MKKIFLPAIAMALFSVAAMAQDIPLVYDVENTAAANPDPVFPTFSELPKCEPLTDPFAFSDGSGRATSFSQWSKRRGEIKREIEHYEIGDKPAVSLDDIEASMEGNKLTVVVTVNGKSLTLTSTINYPAGGTAPYPLMIGASNNSLPGSLLSSRNIATMNFTESQVNGYSQMGGSGSRGTYPFDNLYPDLIDNGAYSEWAWGFSRLLDGLQKLGPEVTKIDMNHIGVTGCSYAGKMALFCGAFDERVALTIAQEPGGGGAAAWRVTRVHNRDYKKEDSWEGLDNTDYHWFMESLRNTFGEDKTFYLPYDHHELAAMCCPRALLMLGNPDYRWLADGSGYVSMEGARKVWEQYGIQDRCGYSIVAGHGHCSLPSSQYPEVEAFLDRFLLGLDVNTDGVTYASNYQAGGDRATALEDLDQWIGWWGVTDTPPDLPDNRPVAVRLWGNVENMVAASCDDWVIETDEDSPTGKCARAAVTNTAYPTDPSKALTYTFTVPTTQDYYIYAYVNCPASSSDAFWIAFDDGTPLKSNGNKTSGGYAWQSLYAKLSTADKAAFKKNLTAGEHTAYIYAKEPDAKVALICVSNTDALSDFKSDIEGIDLSSVTTDIRSLAYDGNSSKALRGVSTEDGMVRVLVSANETINGSIDIYNAVGVKVASQKVNMAKGNHVVTFARALAKGIYVVKMSMDNSRSAESRSFVVR